MKALGNTLTEKPKKALIRENPSLEITTLGGLSIRRDGQPVPALHSRKAQALLVYLAVMGRPQSREVLADLLWEEFSQHKAMNNLRVVLSNLRKHLGDHLLITRDTAAMNPEVDYDLDVAVLDANLDYAGRFERKTSRLDREVAARIEQAVDLYKGEFLEGFFVERALEFDAWMVVERERVHHMVLDGLGKLVRWELGQGAYTAGIRHASRWTQLDPLSETAHRQMMRLLAYSGQRGAALAQFDKCRKILTEELGLEPDPKTIALYEQIRAGELGPDETISLRMTSAETIQPDARRHNLPVQTTSFIGREHELADLNQLLRDPSVRLVTVVGAGGMGKTRLALEAGEGVLDQFLDGVFFVPLTRLKSEELIVPSIIQALGIEFLGGDTGGDDSQAVIKESLFRNLRGKQMLLILDNFEHLLDGADLVGEIIQVAPEVKVLATSRSQLNISGEHRFHVAGMDYPEDIKDVEAQKYSAVRLFLESARRACSSFTPQSNDLKYIIDICRLVEGMPLGVQLAAAWVEMLSPEEIAAEIAQSLDLLETDLRDVAERHRSIRALFDHSWNLLGPREREVFRGFSVFRGGCTREVAQEITGARLHVLRSLVNKSLLQRALNGRYEIHELAREYANGKLRKSLDAWNDVHDRHCTYYSAEVQRLGRDLKSRRQLTALTEMDLEIDNARAAWNWAVKRRRGDLVDQSMEGFRHYFAIRRLIQEAERVFRQAADGFKSATSGDELRVYARLLNIQGYFSDGNEKKKVLYQQSLTILDELDKEGHDIRYEKAQALNYLGYIVAPSDFDEAIRLFEDTLKLFTDLSSRFWEADTLLGFGTVYFLHGKLDEAQKAHQQSLVIFQELGDPRMIARSFRELDIIARRRGKLEESERLARERLEIYKRIGDNAAIADGMADLGVALLVLGKFEEAHTYLKEASKVHQELDNFEDFLFDTIMLCWTKLSMGQYSQAWDRVQYAVDWCHGKVSEASEAQASSVQSADLSSVRLDRYEPSILGQALSVQGAASMALGRLTDAEHSLQGSIAAFQKTHTMSASVHPYSDLGALYIKIGQPARARKYLHRALKMGVEINSAMSQIRVLSEVSLILAEEGALERAIEIYALASRYLWIGESQWHHDVIEHPLDILTSSLPEEVIEAAQKRGRERDLEGTVQELLAELA